MNSTNSETSGILWVTSRVLIVTILFSLGVIGNGIVLKIFRKDKSQVVYVIVLAWTDLLESCIILPQIPLNEARFIPNRILMAQGLVLSQVYFFVQVAMVFDRLFAVFLPFKFVIMRRKTNTVLAVAYCAVQVYLQVLGNIYRQRDHVVPAVLFIYAVIFGLMLVAYPAIALKLWKQSRRIKPTAANQQNQPSAATGNPNKVISETQQRTKHHIKTLKLYVAILVLFLAAATPASIVTVDKERRYDWVKYFFFVKNAGNPFIYYTFNDKFRNDVKQMFVKLCRCRCSCRIKGCKLRMVFRDNLF